MTEKKSIKDYPKPIVLTATAIVLTGFLGAIVLVWIGLAALFTAVLGG